MSAIEAIADKYFDRAIAANVTFGRGPHDDFTCDIVAPVTQGVVLKASGRAGEAHVAFEGAADKIERQLRRYMSRLRKHKGNGAGRAARLVENAGYTIFAVRPRPSEPPAQPADHRRDPGRYSRRHRVRRGDAARPPQHQRLDVQQLRQRAPSTWSIDETTAPSAGSNRRAE